MYNSPTDVKIGDIVYMAEFIDIGNGREIYVRKLVVHSVDELGNIAVRDADRPNVALGCKAIPEWMPSWSALSSTPEEAISRLETAAEHGWV